jgi:hypothetical protein
MVVNRLILPKKILDLLIKIIHMQRNLPNQKLVLAGIKGTFFLLLVTLFTLSANAQRVVGHPRGHISSANLATTYQTSTGQPGPLTVTSIDPYAVYSNIQVANFSGYAYPNGSNGASNGYTTLVCDDIQFDGSSSVYNIDKVRFTIFNFNALTKTVRPSISFYTMDPTTFMPDVLIASYTFNPISITAGNGSIVTGTLSTPFLVYDQNIWAGISFDRLGGSTATLAELENFGPGMFGYADVGYSDDIFWQSFDADNFTYDAPSGDFYDFNPDYSPANFGWELIQDNPIPVTIEYLHGNRNGNRHDLSWKISTIATPQVTITLQRGDNKRNFSDLYTITADAQRCMSPFNYTDASPLEGMNYYRLKITDLDGKVKYGTIIALLNKPSGFEIVGISPNPVTNSSNAVLTISSAQKDQLQVTIYDMSGRLVMSQSHSVIAGSNQISLDVSKLAKGIYHVNGCSSDGTSKTISLLKH